MKHSILSHKVLLVATSIFFATGCDSPNAPAVETPSMQLTTSSAWQGGTFTVRGFAPSDTAPVVYVDSLRAGLIGRGGDSAVFQIPSELTGSVAVSIGEKRVAAGRIAVAGVTGIDDMPFAPTSSPSPWYVGGVASVVTSLATSPPGSPLSTRIVRYVLSTRTVDELFPGSEAYDLSRNGTRTPHGTADPNVFGFTRYTADVIDLFHFPDGVQVGTFPIVKIFPVRQVALLSSGALIWTGPHHTFTRTSPSGTNVYFQLTQGDEDPPEIALSAGARQAAIPSNGSPFGLPVFGNDGQLLYRIASAKTPYAVRFSPTGDTLYVANRGVGPDGKAGGQILEVIASTGQIVMSTDLGWHIAEDVALDPSGRWLYAATMRDSRNPAGPPEYLQVLDAKTLAVVGRIRLGISASSCAMQTVADADGLYVVCDRKVVRIARP